jgi:hypothetical protein
LIAEKERKARYGAWIFKENLHRLLIFTETRGKK